MNLNSGFLKYSKINWVKSQNINAARIITAGAIADKDGKIDQDKFLETKKYIYDSNRGGAIKQTIIMSIIDSVVNAIGDIVLFIVFYGWITTLSETHPDRLALMDVHFQKIIWFAVACIAVPEVIMHFVKKAFKKKEAEIDEWAKRQIKEQNNAIETADS